MTHPKELIAEVSPVELYTDRLTLREFTCDDVSGVHALLGDNRVTTWLSFDSRTPDQTDAMMAGILDRQHAEPRMEYYLAVVERDRHDDIVGFARLGLGGVNAADLGYAIRPERQGYGYGREAAATMLDFGFHKLGLHRITANIGPTNTASIQLVRHLGFTHEGTIRDHVFTNGEWRDSESYSLLEHEWTHQPCAHCERRMLPRKGGRARQFCSAACRQAAYRERHPVNP